MARFLFVCLLLLSQLSQAASVNYIYRGSVSLTDATVSVTLCDTVDLDPSVLFFSTSINDATTSGTLIAGRLTDNQTIEFERDGNAGTAEI